MRQRPSLRALPLLLVMSLLLATRPAHAVLPGLAIQGILHSAAGGPVSDGDYAVTVSFYLAKDDAKAASSETVAVKVQGGLFATSLKVSAAEGASNFAYIGVSVGVEPELPRVAISSVLHAWHAGQADSADVAKSIQCSGCVGASQIDPAALAPYATWAKLADVATTGAYADLKSPPVLAKLGDCPAGQLLLGFGADGSAHCAPDQNTTYDGSNFALSGKSCGGGQMVIGIAANGVAVCAPAVSVPAYGSCPAGSAIASIGADGKVTCNQKAFKLVAGPSDIQSGNSLILTHNLNTLDIIASGWVDSGGGYWQAVQSGTGSGGPAVNVAAAKNGGKCTAQSSSYGNTGIDGGYGCSHALDGIYADGDGSAWATQNEGAGSFMTVTFDKAYALSAIGYMQRGCSCEWNKTLTLSFSDGSTQTVVLDNIQGPKQYALTAVTTSWVKVTVKDVYATTNNGAAEVEFMGTVPATSLVMRKTLNTVEILNQTASTQKLQLVVAP